MFYDVFCELCRRKNVAPTRAALDIGLSKSTPTAWKKRQLTPQGETLNKIAEYFGVSVDYLLGTEEKEKVPTSEKGEHNIDYDLKAAFWGGDKDLSPEDLEEMWNDVKNFADFVKAQKKKEKGL